MAGQLHSPIGPRVIRYRPFRNTDPPALAEIWRAQPRMQRLAQPMSAGQLELHVFSKTYFDPAGLIVAMEGARPIGFVHAGFGPDITGAALDREQGVICRLMVHPHRDQLAIMSELLDAAEDYLRRGGARSARVGNVSGRGPFYLGFYGSAILAGLMISDQDQVRFFSAANYQPETESTIFQRSLIGFRPPVDRDQMRHRRTLETRMSHDPGSETWWEASTTASVERLSFELQPKVGGGTYLAVKSWFMTPLSISWGVRAAGFETFHLPLAAWQDGTAILLLADAMKLMLTEGITLVEAVLSDQDIPARQILLALGFQEVERSVSLLKTL